MGNESDDMEYDQPGTSASHSSRQPSQSSLPDVSSQTRDADEANRLGWRLKWSNLIKKKSLSQESLPSIDTQSSANLELISSDEESFRIPSSSSRATSSNLDRKKSATLPSLNKIKSKKNDLTEEERQEIQREKWRNKKRRQTAKKKEETEERLSLLSTNSLSMSSLDMNDDHEESSRIPSSSPTFSSNLNGNNSASLPLLSKKRRSKYDPPPTPEELREKWKIKKRIQTAKKKDAAQVHPGMQSVDPSSVPLTPSSSIPLSRITLNDEDPTSDQACSSHGPTTPTRRRKTRVCPSDPDSSQNMPDDPMMEGTVDEPDEAQEDGMTAADVDSAELSRNRAAKYITPLNTQVAPILKLKTRIMTPEQRDFSKMVNAVPPFMYLGNPLTCFACGARTFTLNCCSKGRVKIPPPRAPPKLFRMLLLAPSIVGNHFRENCVKYNTAFAVGSLSYDRDREDVRGPPFVKVNGMMHHYLSGSSVPNEKTLPMFHQLYKYDGNTANHFRMENPILKDVVMPNILRNIQMVLEEENYLIKQYKTAVEILGDMAEKKQTIKNVMMVLVSPSEIGYQGAHHPGTLSRPKEEMQSFLYTMDTDGAPPKNGISIVHRYQGGRLEVIGYYNPLADPTGYPILFPRGNCGFKRGEYKLDVDYTSGLPEDDEWDDNADYPFEGLNDEMEKGVQSIQYDRARVLYKEHLRMNGEVVSDSEVDDDEDDEEDQPLSDDLYQESPSEEREDTAEEEFRDDEDEDTMDEIGSETGEPPGQLLLKFGSDDEDDFVQPEIEADPVPPKSDDPLRDESMNVGDVPDQLYLYCSDDDDEEDKAGHVDDEDECVQESRPDDWREREKEAQEQMEERERRTLVKIRKIDKFKEICLKSRGTPNFFHKFFRDPVEIRRVQIDLNFLERKRLMHIDYLYYLANVLFDMSPSRIEYSYPFDEDFKQLEIDINYELSCIVADPTYREKDPKIAHYRITHYLNASEHDDNEEKELEDLDDLVQRHVGEDMVKEMENKGKKSKKEWKPVRAKGGPLTNVSRRQYALHQMQTRDPLFHPYLSTMKLGQLYVIDFALRIIRQRNDNTRDHMIKLRGSHENTLTFKMHSQSAERKGFTLGYAFSISPDKPGSTSWYKLQFENAMAIMDYCGKADIFITMTGDPHWAEIAENKLPFSEWQSNPFLVNDVFYVKMQELLNDVIANRLFGPVLSYCYSVEFQKRGMPHMHLLITLQDGYKLDTSTKIDKYIKATIPPEPDADDPEFELKTRFRKNVVDNMIHSACKDNPDATCKKGARPGSNRCTKMFPFPFNTHTSTIDGGKVSYHRPDDKVTCKKKVNRKMVELGNNYVVPYCPFLLNKYGCHINVEAVTTVDVVKYIYKYIYKGFDKALATFIELSEVDNGSSGLPCKTVVHAKKNGRTSVMVPKGLKGTRKQFADMDERIAQELRKKGIVAKPGERLTAFDEAIMVEVFRQMTPSEGAWIIQKYPLSCLSHSVVNLSVHVEGEMPVFFRHGEEEKMKEKVESGAYKSPLVAWFSLNKRDANARMYTYAEIPLHYTFERDQKSSEWRRYIADMTTRNIVRIRPVSPRFLETFCVRLLAMNQRGPRSFEELRTVRNVVFKNNHEAAKALGLIDSQTEFEVCLREAGSFNFPNRLRALLATILVFGGATDPLKLWEENKDSLIDRRYQLNKERGYAAALYHIQHMLAEHGMKLSTYHLPDIPDHIPDSLSSAECQMALDGYAPMDDPRDDDSTAQDLKKSLNATQRRHFDTIIEAVEKSGMNGTNNCFFLQGSGGCGKTYLYCAIYHHLRIRDIKVSMMATTGIAATLLIKGTTVHKKFMLPINGEAGSRSTLETDSNVAEELRRTTVFIIDEATMMNKFMLEAIDVLLRDITGFSGQPFGGKIMLLGGDWKQLLPVVPGSYSSEVVQYTLQEHPLWKHFKILSLSKNMRAQKDPDYSILLENIGNGCVNGTLDSDVFLQPDCIIQSADEVINTVYSDLTIPSEELADKCILASLNTETVEINEKVLQMAPGVMKTYTAIDTPAAAMGMQPVPEYFRHQMPSGVPPYALNLKKGAIVILLRNLNVSVGLCNGTRMVVTAMHDHFIECVLLTTNFRGSTHWISKINVEPSGTGKKKPLFSRFQLPIRLAYAMTINKSQGQTFEEIGVVLNNNVFAHGQLYVALSRARESGKVRIFSSARKLVDGLSVVVVKNLVEQNVLKNIPKGKLYNRKYVRPDLVTAIDVREPFLYVTRGKKRIPLKLGNLVSFGFSIVIMASKLVRDKGLCELTSMEDIATGEVKLPITGLIHGFDQFNKDTMIVSVLTDEGRGNVVKIDKKLWNLNWKKINPVGKVVEFKGNVVSGTRAHSFSISTDSIPKVLQDEKTFAFVRSSLPDYPSSNCMLVVEFAKKLENKADAKPNAPQAFDCILADGLTVQVKAFGGQSSARLEKCTAGSIIHIGPVKYASTEYCGRMKYTFTTNYHTVVHAFNGTVDDFPAQFVSSIEEVFDKVTGDNVSLEAILLTDVEDGCAWLTDRSFPSDPPLRISLFKVPDTCVLKKGQSVKVVAQVYNYDSIRLDCKSIVHNPPEDDDNKIFEVLAFTKYKAMILKRAHEACSSPSTSQSSSQRSSIGEPDCKREKHD